MKGNNNKMCMNESESIKRLHVFIFMKDLKQLEGGKGVEF